MHNLLNRHHATYSLFGIEQMTNSESRVGIATLVSGHALGHRSQEATIRASWRGVPLSGPAAAEVVWRRSEIRALEWRARLLRTLALDQDNGKLRCISGGLDRPNR
jgi:hypothetical protein